MAKFKKPAEEEPVKQVEPVVVPPSEVSTDYQIFYEDGKLDPNRTVMRARVQKIVYYNDGSVKKLKADQIGTQSIENGYGLTNADAMNDFIRRNPSNVLNAIFDVCVKG